MITRELGTTSYGHILARQLRVAVNEIPECQRQEMADAVRAVAYCGVTGYTADPTVKAYVIDLLEGRTPSVRLGHNRKLEDRNGKENSGLT